MEVVQVDANTMKRMVLSVEKRINENMQLRMKYADAPERYMDSELALFQELKAMHTLATAPELYATFVRTRCVPSLLGLLAHENADISMDVVDLFHELCEAEDAEPDALLALVDAMLENGAAAALMQHLGRLDEAEEEEAAMRPQHPLDLRVGVRGEAGPPPPTSRSSRGCWRGCSRG